MVIDETLVRHLERLAALRLEVPFVLLEAYACILP